MGTQYELRIREMFQIQDKLNKVIAGDDYATKGIPFYRAAIVESAELMDHIGYKWWKHTEPDIAQAKLEVVDIWHFVMSEILSNHTEEDIYSFIIEDIAALFKSVKYPSNKKMQLKATEIFMVSMLGYEDSSEFTESFVELVSALEMDFNELYRTYIGKNALNYFRQDNGYKEGTYIKNNWKDKDGKPVEDNVVLAEILESEWNTLNDVYTSLGTRYSDAQSSAGC